jgi:hypothetical protein
MFRPLHLLNVTPKLDVIIAPSSPQRDANVPNQTKSPKLVRPLTDELTSSEGAFPLVDKR